MKKIIKLIVLIISLCVFSKVTAHEQNVIDLTKKGSISISLISSEKDKVSGAEITIYKLADATIKNNNLNFVFNEKLNTCKENIERGILTNNELECVLNNKIDGINDITDKDGKVTFNNLDLGLYLIMQKNDVKNFSKIKSFLLSIPTIENNKWIYDINGTPKIEISSLFDLTVVKEWNVINNDKIPYMIEVELLENGRVLDSVILNTENNWTYTWNQLIKSDSYSVREKNVPIGFTPTYSINNDIYVITNSQTLVQTGNMPWISYTLCLVGIICLTIGIYLDKRENNEKK